MASHGGRRRRIAQIGPHLGLDGGVSASTSKREALRSYGLKESSGGGSMAANGSGGGAGRAAALVLCSRCCFQNGEEGRQAGVNGGGRASV
jgi:hypothetical protein